MAPHRESSEPRRALSALAVKYAAPAQNGVVADRNGDIAIRSTGLFPLHPDGIGLEIRDGTVGASDWLGFWPLERYPQAFDPRQGYLASANQQPIDPRQQRLKLAIEFVHVRDRTDDDAGRRRAFVAGTCRNRLSPNYQGL